MSTVEVILLGSIQGLTEFLPVSSDGHLFAACAWFGLADSGGIAFDAWLHLGTLFAVLIYFWRIWWGIVRGLMSRGAERQEARDLVTRLAVATIPGAVVGYWLRDSASWLHSPLV